LGSFSSERNKKMMFYFILLFLLTSRKGLMDVRGIWQRVGKEYLKGREKRVKWLKRT